MNSSEDGPKDENQPSFLILIPPGSKIKLDDRSSSSNSEGNNSDPNSKSKATGADTGTRPVRDFREWIFY